MKSWKKMLKQYVNEVGYMARCAGINSSMSVGDDKLAFYYSSYNDKVTEYLKYYFGQFRTFKFDEEFFKNVVEKKTRVQKNKLKLEPYQRVLTYVKKALLGEAAPREYVAEYEKVDYKQLMEFREKFVKQLRFEWLICGHIDEAGAKEVCETVLKSVDHQALPSDQKQKRAQMAKIPDKTVCDIEVSAQPPKSMDPTADAAINPNSACRSFFQFGPNSFELLALAKVVADLIE